MNKQTKEILNSKNCNICPRQCNVNRNEKLGFCGANNVMHISKIMVHMWEEPYLINDCDNSKSNKKGSGAIFFSSCNLKCLYCQNYEISSTTCGKPITPLELTKIFKKLEAQNVCNINLVTPTHYAKQIIEALRIYKPKVPVIYNTSGYENESTICALKGLIDIFLFDFKYINSNLSKNYSNATNYPEICKTALIQARKQIKKDKFKKGIMQKGLIIRYLLLPNTAKDGIDILNFIKKHLGINIYISLLNQYVPTKPVLTHPVLSKKPKQIEYKLLIEHAKNLKLKNVFIQENSSASENFIPDFSMFCDF